jgi:hypothetical protein
MLDLESMSTADLEVLIDRARRVVARRSLAEGRLRVVDSFREGDTRYLLQYVKCGKAKHGKCRRCREGAYHGPYWYGYRWTGENMESTYHGKARPGTMKGARDG